MYTNNSRCQLSGKKNSSKLIILNEIANLLGYYGEAFASQFYLGKKANIRREAAHYATEAIVNLGIIVKVYRHRKTCRYFFTSEFLNTRHEYYDIIPALRKISLIMLFSPISNLFARNRTPNISNNIYNRTSRYSLVTVRAAGYHFYEKGYGQEITIPILIASKQIAAKNQITSKERVMEQTVTQQLAAAFNLNAEQAEQYSNQYSKSVLLKALQSFEKQRKTRKITNPQGWLAWVTADEERKEKEHALRFPKNGNEGGHSTKASNPNGHSPSQELPNLTHIEQVEYLAKEIMKFSRTYDTSKAYSPDAHMNEYLHKIAANSIASMQNEVDQLLAAFDDPNHTCFAGCVDKSLFLRPEKHPSYDPDFYQPSSDKEYEQHLDEISRDKSDPEKYKHLVRRYDYRRTARR